MPPKNEEAIHLIRESSEGVLATLEDGKPFNSAVSYLYEPGEPFGKAYFLISSLARHTKNLQKNSQASLLVLEPGTAYVYERKRVSVQGTAVKLTDKGKFDELKEKYLSIYPHADKLFLLTDFAFYEFNITDLYYVGGFGQIAAFK